MVTQGQRIAAGAGPALSPKRPVSGALKLSCVVTASAPAGVLQDAFLSPCVATIARPGQRRTVTMKGQGNTLTRCAPCGLAQRGAAPLDSRPSPGGRDAGGKASLLPCLEGVGIHLHQA